MGGCCAKPQAEEEYHDSKRERRSSLARRVSDAKARLGPIMHRVSRHMGGGTPLDPALNVCEALNGQWREFLNPDKEARVDAMRKKLRGSGNRLSVLSHAEWEGHVAELLEEASLHDVSEAAPTEKEPDEKVWLRTEWSARALRRQLAQLGEPLPAALAEGAEGAEGAGGADGAPAANARLTRAALGELLWSAAQARGVEWAELRRLELGHSRDRDPRSRSTKSFDVPRPSLRRRATCGCEVCRSLAGHRPRRGRARWCAG